MSSSFHHLHFDGSILPYFSLSYSYGIMTGDLFHNVIVASLEKVLVLIRQSLAVRKVPETFTSHLKKNYNYKFSTVVLQNVYQNYQNDCPLGFVSLPIRSLGLWSSFLLIIGQQCAQRVRLITSTDCLSFLQDKFRGLKTAPEDSLTFFLAVCICIVYHSYGGE